ncbi:hypothetical protein predicted by Glimmer/Critica [Lactiplantibacillus plantarum]|nr:hypothetical protein predicted by Glimmer/Critica [Lactiplantibacillus plantarum]
MVKSSRLNLHDQLVLVITQPPLKITFTTPAAKLIVT